MGLLDDAIREHLELKRRRGADPGEVAREQHEALDPVPREHASPSGEDEQLAVAGAHDVPHGAAIADHAPSASGGGETEELDMRAVLDAQDAEAGDAELVQDEPAGGEQSAPHADPATPQNGGDSLEWEMPSDAAEQAAPGEQELDDDVLEETPEFLRDTPEQERLWFEQRPPRDFDFDG